MGGSDAVDAVGYSLGERGLLRVGLSLRQGAVLNGGGELLLSSGDQCLDHLVNRNFLGLGDVRQALATLHRGTQCIGAHVEGLRGGGVSLCHVHPAEVTAIAFHPVLGQLLVQGGGNLVGLRLGQGAVAGQAAERALDAGKAAGDRVVRSGGGGWGDDHGAQCAGGESAGENEADGALVHGVLLVRVVRCVPTLDHAHGGCMYSTCASTVSAEHPTSVIRHGGRRNRG